MGIHITHRPPAMTLDTCIYLSCTVISSGKAQKKTAYEQLLSRLGEITEEGQFVGLAPTLGYPCHKEPSLGSLRPWSGRMEKGSLPQRRGFG